MHQQQKKRVGFVSLGCPKALVDSQRILSRLTAEGYASAADYSDADVVIVNTCGFLDSARDESLEAIGEALSGNGKVIVTGCLGAQADVIRDAHPNVLAVTGPQQYEAVVAAVHTVVPPAHDPFTQLVPPGGVRLTPDHYAYLKISEGCNHRCSFCVIPQLRGRLASRPVDEVLREAETLIDAGVRELLVISQDTSAYGVDLRFQTRAFDGRNVRTRLTELARELGRMGAWVRLHYVYPYPHVDELIPLMAEGLVLPYLDIPFQHASPAVLRAMRRPASDAQTLERIAAWRSVIPDMTIRSSFIVGFPGETESDFAYLLEWLEAAQLDRVGCFKYENVDGAASNQLPDAVTPELIDERWERFMEKQRHISETRLAARIGSTIDVIVDSVTDEAIVGRSSGDAPEIDGNVYLPVDAIVSPGDIVRAEVEHADEYDLWADPLTESEA
ncbi:MAG: 30S ribosomal protein S12 methylthiotransferase RimO [Gammaproteobacteria bacterium]